MNSSNLPDPLEKIELKNADELYIVVDAYGKPIQYDQANGRELFNHYRHNLTNYDQVLDDVRQEQGRVTGFQQKQATAGAAEVILERYRDEHVKVIQDAQHKGSVLKKILQKAGVGTVSALTNWMDSCSEALKTVAHLESSQRSLQTWNDTYRVQQKLVKQVLLEAGTDPKIIQKISAIYGTRSPRKALDLGCDLLNWERSQVVKLVKAAVRYSKLEQ
jgi:hypothetical protein